MQVIEQREFSALCRGRTGEQEINTIITGPLEEGAWVLSFLGSAREVISAEDARKIQDALDAVDAVMRGEEIDIDAHFPDLTRKDRKPGSF